ncbi:MAG: hypothetical protein UV82_C0007G0101 [Candidatus Magasanikbacteria bacterium GW2011_GWD2_43_18]|uniref:Uncharacterized protein n=1 Tax=Candidatus Magasanikbacteria bacterium GW2011_GWE2_42_7 TaxID=1619052 RepID=A0A0G1E743_9BACT|nr:MAG: hypothetical protein UV18_C0010G0006 [Candidatus Magasanikbacteria bacterium GW2011_GWC2_42_27]KKS70383.1 MAG: hypothetical protein UV42_C0057G0009 [Candidatus Magasanikbacteria bacterium GW2011_GWE2_42_7]KKT04601.1 MAG: hypothetical protein UV82_C0007G0101 [Candidatus Magasanikbacteria bacterium GW2011_GWD2_43_18]KKT24439.1 MAG: hypothetical protein UW10_C0026G0006 [Candidatus Magasanikbacteria bacterium GW2011_GWA2_43_9]
MEGLAALHQTIGKVPILAADQRAGLTIPDEETLFESHGYDSIQPAYANDLRNSLIVDRNHEHPPEDIHPDNSGHETIYKGMTFVKIFIVCYT